MKNNHSKLFNISCKTPDKFLFLKECKKKNLCLIIDFTNFDSTFSWHSRHSCVGHSKAQGSLMPMAPPLINGNQLINAFLFFPPGRNFCSTSKVPQKISQNWAAIFQSSNALKKTPLHWLFFLLFHSLVPTLAPWDHFPNRVSIAKDLSQLRFPFKYRKCCGAPSRSPLGPTPLHSFLLPLGLFIVWQ